MPFQPTYEVVEERQPYTLVPQSENQAHARRGVLMLHGFMGSPLSSRPMAEVLCQNGFYVHCPLLPGHGSYPNKLHNVGRKDWFGEAEEAYRFASSHCDELFLIGHSMGGVLCAHLETTFGGVKGIVLVAPVYDVPDERLRYVKYARHFMPWYYPHKSKRESMQKLVRERVLDFDSTIDFDDPEFQEQLPELSRVPIAGMHEMVETIYYGRPLWPQIQAPVRILAGEEDVAADPANARRIMQELGTVDKQLTVYPHAGHELMRPSDPVHPKAWQAVLDFLEAHSKEAIDGTKQSVAGG